jgi:hypothetical protein
MGLIVGSVVLVFVALLGMRLLPSYLEYFTIKQALAAIGNEMRGRDAQINEVRRAFSSRAIIDDIKSVEANDLVISKQGNDYDIAVAYRKEIPLFANIGVYIDFEASSK